MSLASFPRSLHPCLKVRLLIPGQPSLSMPRVPSWKSRLGCGDRGWARGQPMGGSAGANLTAGVWSLATRSLRSSLGSGLGFSSSDVESSGMGVHFCLSGFGHWAWASQKYPCCRGNKSHLLFELDRAGAPGAWLISFTCFLGSCCKDAARAVGKAACSSCLPAPRLMPGLLFPHSHGRTVLCSPGKSLVVTP